MPTPESKKVQKSIWFDRLKRFSDEIIMQAVNKSLDYEFPELSHVIKLCEEFSATSRYKMPVLTDQRSAEPSDMVKEHMKQTNIAPSEAREEFKRLYHKLTGKKLTSELNDEKGLGTSG